LSDGLPGNLFPAPVHLPLMVTRPQTFEEYHDAKDLKKIAWLTFDDFCAVCRGLLTVRIKNAHEAIKVFTTLHSSINRITGTTGDEGSLFELEEYVLDCGEPQTGTISIYLRIVEGWENRVMSLFSNLAQIGYGKKKSAGKGAFEIIGKLEPFDRFEDISEANGFVSLSNFMPAKDDPTEGFYKTMVKYGKLGGEFTFGGNPFKKPLLMIQKGSVFKTNGKPRDFYGRVVSNVAPARPEVVQYGYGFAVPITINL
jgi:CRISPR-associated protein Csm4